MNCILFTESYMDPLPFKIHKWQVAAKGSVEMFHKFEIIQICIGSTVIKIF
jgi:hypothetical protein